MLKWLKLYVYFLVLAINKIIYSVYTWFTDRVLSHDFSFQHPESFSFPLRIFFPWNDLYLLETQQYNRGRGQIPSRNQALQSKVVLLPSSSFCAPAVQALHTGGHLPWAIILLSQKISAFKNLETPTSAKAALAFTVPPDWWVYTWTLILVTELEQDWVYQISH